MNLFQELCRRRMLQYLSAYCVGGFGLVEFIEFLEGRLLFSPHIVNLIAVALLFLLPGVVILAWSQGRPGKDHWGRAEKLALSANFIATFILLFVLFGGKDLGGVTTTVEVEDENGLISERQVPKKAFRKRVILYNFDNDGPESDEWLRSGMTMLLELDLSQDAFLDTRHSTEMVKVLRDAGNVEGLGLPRAKQRKIARDAHFPCFLTGTIHREGETLFVETTLHDSNRGSVMAARDFQGTDPLSLVDEISLQLRRDLGVPAGYINDNLDAPVAELASEDIQAVKAFIQAGVLVTAHNEWAKAMTCLLEATERDPTFALAQYLLSGTCAIAQRPVEAEAAVDAAMDNLYRLPERVRLRITCMYYLSQGRSADKSMSVVDMWIQLYPQDADAYLQKAFLHELRNNLPAAIAAYENALEADPQQYEILQSIGDLYADLGDLSRTEKYLLRYAEHFPANVQAWLELADAYMDFGKLDQASRVLEKALLIEPARMATRLTLADIAAKNGDFASAHSLLDEMETEVDTPREQVDVQQGQMTLLKLRGRIHDALQRVEEWLPAAAEIYAPPEVNIRQAFMLRLLVDAGRSAELLVAADDLATKTTMPVDRLIAYTKLRPLIDLGRLDEADEMIVDVDAVIASLQIEVWRPRIVDAKGRLAAARGEYETSAMLFREALELAPNSPGTMRRLGRTLRLWGKHNEAKSVLVEVLAFAPGNAEVNLELALLYIDMDKPEQARERLRVALLAWADADPEYKPAATARALMENISGALQ